MNGTDDGAVAAHSAQLAEFVAASALLTGFDEAELTADGMASAPRATPHGPTRTAAPAHVRRARAGQSAAGPGFLGAAAHHRPYYVPHSG